MQAVAEPFIVIPLLALAIGTAKPSEGNWSGAMVNDMRSFGGTLGGGIITTILRQREQFQSNILVQTVPAGSTLTGQRLRVLGQNAAGHAADNSAQMLQAVRSLSATVQREAFVMAYAHEFTVLASIMLATLVLAAFLRIPLRPGTPPGGK